MAFTGRQPRAPSLTLPSPDAQYNQQNEAQTRRLIEQFFIRFGEARANADPTTVETGARTRVVVDVPGVSDAADQITGEINVGASELLFQFDCVFPMRVRFYESADARTLDLARDIDTDPDPDVCALEVIMPVADVVAAVAAGDLTSLVVDLRSVDGSGAPLIAANRDGVLDPGNVLYYTVDTFALDSGELDTLLAGVAPGAGPYDFTYHNPCDALSPYGSCPGNPPMQLSDDGEWNYPSPADNNQTVVGDLFIGRANAVLSPPASPSGAIAARPTGYSVTEIVVDLFRLSVDGSVDKIAVLMNAAGAANPFNGGVNFIFRRHDAGTVKVQVDTAGGATLIATSSAIALAASSGAQVRVVYSPDEGEIRVYSGAFLGALAGTLVDTLTGLSLPTLVDNVFISGSRDGLSTGIGLSRMKMFYRRLDTDALAASFALTTLPVEGAVE